MASPVPPKKRLIPFIASWMDPLTASLDEWIMEVHVEIYLGGFENAV
jgi:hypothetical protein